MPLQQHCGWISRCSLTFSGQQYYKLLKLDGPTIDRIRQMAEGEDRDARYGLGRYLYVVRPEEDCVDRAFEYLQKAYAQGQSDAVAAYTEGCLTKYASGMEKVHIPAFDADDEDVDSDEDDYPDDDGRFDAYA